MFMKELLRVVYDDHSSSYSDFVMTKSEPTIHQYSIKNLTKEMHKLKNDLSPPLTDDMFQVQNNTFNLRRFQKSVNNIGLETISYCASIVEYGSS